MQKTGLEAPGGYRAEQNGALAKTQKSWALLHRLGDCSQAALFLEDCFLSHSSSTLSSLGQELFLCIRTLPNKIGAAVTQINRSRMKPYLYQEKQ